MNLQQRKLLVLLHDDDDDLGTSPRKPKTAEPLHWCTELWKGEKMLGTRRIYGTTGANTLTVYDSSETFHTLLTIYVEESLRHRNDSLLQC